MKLSKKTKIVLAALAAAGATAILIQFLAGRDIAVLNPKGTIGHQQQDLIITATLLMLIVVVPVFALTFFIAWKYREGNKKARYTPDWDHNRTIEFTWWAVPSAIILVLAVIAWKSSHTLDPFTPIRSDKQAMTIQVVALQWKWLFIYPEQGVASVNFVQFPENTPVSFEITSDAPMNSFWIPQLGGQVYAMAGMKTKLHLEADDPGSFQGSSANISGRGFASMNFTAKSSTQDDFETWIKSARSSMNHLSLEQYDILAKPSEGHPASQYSSYDNGLYERVMAKYMAPGFGSPHTYHGGGAR